MKLTSDYQINILITFLIPLKYCLYGVGSLLTRETVQVEQSDTSVSLGVVNPKFAPYRFLI